MGIPTYIVRPHPTGQGAQLSGPDLPWALWYDDELHAAARAHGLLLPTGGRVLFEDSTGYVMFTEHVPTPAGGPQRRLYEGTELRGDADAGG